MSLNGNDFSERKKEVLRMKEYVSAKETLLDRKQYLDKVNNDWQLYIQEKKKTKDMRLLFLQNTSFFSILTSLLIESAIWWESPYDKKDPSFSINMQSNIYSLQQIRGEWGKKIEVQVTQERYSSNKKTFFNELELEILQMYLEEFGMHEVILNLDTVNWKNE